MCLDLDIYFDIINIHIQEALKYKNNNVFFN